jgi:epoxyqueuosine reductase
MMTSISSAIIKKAAEEVGFSYCGIAELDEFNIEKILFENAIKNGYHANMGYLERDIESRFNPQSILPDCQSVIVVLFNYNTGIQINSNFKISKYAFIKDYHIFLTERLEVMMDQLKMKGFDFEYRLSVDSGKISEKNWAMKAGLGQYGKNGLLLTPQGSYFFIGVALIDKPVDIYDLNEVIQEHYCGKCTICMDHCPTNAIVRPYVIDAKRCLAYQTLSNKTPDYELVKQYPWIYGCDICQDVCPKNKKSVVNKLAVSNSSLFLHFQDADFENLSKEEFDHYFSNTSIGSKGYEKLVQFIKNRQK